MRHPLDWQSEASPNSRGVKLGIIERSKKAEQIHCHLVFVTRPGHADGRHNKSSLVPPIQFRVPPLLKPFGVEGRRLSEYE